MSLLESDRVYPQLKDRRVLLIESPDLLGPLFNGLYIDQGMQVEDIIEEHFPADLAAYIRSQNIDCSVIHVPTVSEYGATLYGQSILEAYSQQPRMVLLEGQPINRETYDMYEKFRAAGIPMEPKLPIKKIVSRLASLFTSE